MLTLTSLSILDSEQENSKILRQLPEWIVGLKQPLPKPNPRWKLISQNLYRAEANHSQNLTHDGN